VVTDAKVNIFAVMVVVWNRWGLKRPSTKSNFVSNFMSDLAMQLFSSGDLDFTTFLASAKMTNPY
jgi:hypothetical protein